MHVPFVVAAITCAAIGILLGCLVATNGFAETKAHSTVNQTNRIKSLGWALAGGGAATFGLDFQRFGASPEFQPLVATAIYMMGVVIGYGATVASITATFIGSVKHLNKHKDSRVLIERWAIVRQYLTRGKDAAESALDQAEISAGEKADALAQSLPSPENSISNLITIAAYAVAAHLRKAEAVRRVERVEVVNTVLETACDVIRAQAVEGCVLRSNYMVHRRLEEGSNLPPATMFVDSRVVSYTSYLEAIYSGGAPMTEPVVVPVAGNPGDRARVLPGAPDALVSMRSVVLDVRDITFKKQVAQIIQKRIKKYFKSQDYHSLACIPVSEGMDVYGVLNIESSVSNLIGKVDDAALARALTSIAPLLALLSSLEV